MTRSLADDSPSHIRAMSPSGTGRWGRAEIDALKAAHPLIRVAQFYGVRLTRSGPRSIALCPLHVETHPSFTIYPQEQRWWCFGCGRGGDVIELVRLLEGLSFHDALIRLHGSSTASGVAIASNASHNEVFRCPADGHDYLRARDSPDGRRALAVADACYARELAEHQPALQYLEQRGIPAPLAHRCHVGYCSGTRLVAALRRADVPLAAARSVGLLCGHRNRERLATRITIPDSRGGHVTWLTGRLLAAAGAAPRYLSLPGPRPLLGAECLTRHRSVVLAEGAFDYLTLVRWHLPGVAALGSTLSRSALAELQSTRRIYLAFDRDAAGQTAAQTLVHQLGNRVRMVALPNDVKDINDLARLPEGASRFRSAVRQAADSDEDALA